MLPQGPHPRSLQLPSATPGPAAAGSKTSTRPSNYPGEKRLGLLGPQGLYPRTLALGSAWSPLLRPGDRRWWEQSAGRSRDLSHAHVCAPRADLLPSGLRPGCEAAALGAARLRPFPQSGNRVGRGVSPRTPPLFGSSGASGPGSPETGLEAAAPATDSSDKCFPPFLFPVRPAKT